MDEDAERLRVRADAAYPPVFRDCADPDADRDPTAAQLDPTFAEPDSPLASAFTYIY
jgi:hypothetical protein